MTAIIDPNSRTINGKKNIKIVGPLFDTSKVPPERLMKIPCGQCIGCRMQYSRLWADRLMLELQYHDSAYFVTLTYNDLYVPKSTYNSGELKVSAMTGEVLSEPDSYISLTLRKRHAQLFMKRLRRAFPGDHIRFYLAGEYGEETYRPHYHAIIFGLHLDDLVFYKKSLQGFSYYTSESLQNVWSDPKTGMPYGFVIVAEVTWETCAYTARYVTKKLNGKESEFYTKFNIEPEFTLMSRKPGIARQYYDEHPDIYKYDFINVKTEKGGLKFRPPRYFDKLYDLEHPDEMQSIKDTRQKMAIEAQKAKLSRSSLSPDELLAVEERSFESKIKCLRRDIV